MSKYNDVLAKIERYRKNKTDTVFDDFYHADLDLMVECIEARMATLPEPDLDTEQCDLCVNHFYEGTAQVCHGEYCKEALEILEELNDETIFDGQIERRNQLLADAHNEANEAVRRLSEQ